VDAMGRYSSILKSRGLKNDVLDMGCLAFFLENVNHKNDNRLLLYDAFLPGSDYFWVIPLEEDKLMVGIFFFSALTGANLKDKTEKLKFYMAARHLKGDVYDTKMGNIPLGGQSHVRVENFVCIGDSCNTPLPSSGFSFSRCLEESKILAAFAVKYLDGKASLKDYKKDILGSKIPGIEVHLIISDMLSKFTDPMLNKAIGAMNKLNEDFLISFLTGKDMSLNFAATALRAIFNTYSVAEIRSLSLKQNYLRNLVSLYNLLLALPQAKIGEQLVRFVKDIVKSKYPSIVK
jgi:flavin-dependent dehydrogenase